MTSAVKWVLVCVLASLAAISCGGAGGDDRGNDAAAAGAGGTGGGGGGGTGGVGADGGAGAGGSALAACPPSLDTSVSLGGACQGTFTCNYPTQCTCGVCCYHGLGCSNGVLTYLGFNDGCMQVWPASCPDAGP